MPLLSSTCRLEIQSSFHAKTSVVTLLEYNQTEVNLILKPIVNSECNQHCVAVVYVQNDHS